MEPTNRTVEFFCVQGHSHSATAIRGRFLAASVVPDPLALGSPELHMRACVFNASKQKLKGIFAL